MRCIVNRCRLATEELIRIAAVPQELPLPGGHTASAVARWARTGVNGVVLESIVVGGRVMTSREAVARFLEALNAKRGRWTRERVAVTS
jgi:hypothetical protein